MTNSFTGKLTQLLDDFHDAPDFEVAFKLKLIQERLRFAITALDRVGRSGDELAETSLQLLDAYNLVCGLDQRFARDCLAQSQRTTISTKEAATNAHVD